MVEVIDPVAGYAAVVRELFLDDIPI